MSKWVNEWEKERQMIKSDSKRRSDSKNLVEIKQQSTLLCIKTYVKCCHTITIIKEAQSEEERETIQKMICAILNEVKRQKNPWQNSWYSMLGGIQDKMKGHYS